MNVRPEPMQDIENQRASAPPPPKGEAGSRNSKPGFLARIPVIIVGTIILSILFFFGIGYLVDSFTHESTDDAFLDADYVSVAPRVAGQVKSVFAASNQRIEAGAPILELDPRD